jgi:hypothetical protein
LKTGNVFKYENRLAKSVSAKGGMTAAEALKSANAAVELVREPTLTAIDENLQEIYGLTAALKGISEFHEDALRKMYGCSNRVVAMAGVFGLAELGQAAYSLCELISRFQTHERFQWQLVQVHIDGLRLLRAPAGHSPEHREQVLTGLRQLATSVV